MADYIVWANCHPFFTNTLYSISSQYNTLSATVPIDASPVCIEQLDVVLLPHTQHHGVLGVAQLQDSHLHVGNGVTRLSIQYFRYYSIQW